MTTNCLISFFIFQSLFTPFWAQAVTSSQYTALSNFIDNPYFTLVNQKIIQSYPSYLSQSTVRSVSILTTKDIISFIIVYITRSGSIFRSKSHFNTNKRQLTIQAFGPVSKITSTKPVIEQNISIQKNQIGIGMTKTPLSIDRYHSLLVQSNNMTVIQNRNSKIHTNFSSQISSKLRPGQTTLGGFLIRRSQSE